MSSSSVDISQTTELPRIYIYVQLGYGIPLLLAYVCLLGVLYRKSALFNKSYFQITKIAGTTDLLFYVAFCVYYRLPANSLTGHWFSSAQPSFIWNVIYFIYFYLKLLRLAFIFLLTVNRGTAILTPLKYQRFWSKYTPHSIIATILFPSFSSWIYYNTSVYFNRINKEEEVYTMYPGYPKLFVNTAPMQHSVTLSLIVLSAIINFICIFTLYSKHKNSTAANPGIQKSTETSLFAISFTESMIETIHLSISVYTSFAFQSAKTPEDLAYIFFLYKNNAWFVDLAIFSRPVLLFFGSKPVRKAVLTVCGVHEPTTITYFTGNKSINTIAIA